MSLEQFFREKQKRLNMFFLKYLNNKSDKYMLKGSMALIACYKSDKYINDIELESESRAEFGKICSEFAEKYHFKVININNMYQQTDCYYIANEKYGILNISLKTRGVDFTDRFKRKVNGIMTYDISIIFMEMMNEFIRHRSRDSLDDILYIYKNYKQDLTDRDLRQITESLAYTGVYKIDYYLKSRMDENNRWEVKFVNRLCGDVRWLFRDLGLGYESESDENMLCLMNIREKDNTLSFVGYPEGKNKGRFHMIMDKGTGEVLKLDVPVSDYTVKAQKKMADLIRQGRRIPETEMVCWERDCDWYAGKSGDNPYEVHWVKSVGGLMGKTYLDKYHGMFNSLKEAQLSVRDWWLKNNFAPPYVRQCVTKDGDVWLDYGQYTAFYVFKQVWPHGNEGKGDSHGD